MSNILSCEVVSIPGQATDAPPGSPRKIRVLMERASRREPLFHPKDNLKRLFPDRVVEEEPLPPLPPLDDHMDDLEEADELEGVQVEADLAG